MAMFEVQVPWRKTNRDKVKNMQYGKLKSRFIPRDPWYQTNVVLLVLLFWCAAWAFYNIVIKRPTFDPMRHTIIQSPRILSCGIPWVYRDKEQNDCTEVHFDGWSVGHFVVYASLAAFAPWRFGIVLAVSLLCEAFEYAWGWRGRWLIDPLVNLLGYAAGHLIFPRPYYLGSQLRWLHYPASVLPLCSLIALCLFVNKPPKRLSNPRNTDE